MTSREVGSALRALSSGAAQHRAAPLTSYSVAAILADSLRLHCDGERHHGPAGSGGGDPLVVPIGEAAFKVRLKPDGTGRYVPRAIVCLCAPEILHALLIDRIRLGYAAEVERIERFSGGIGI